MHFQIFIPDDSPLNLSPGPDQSSPEAILARAGLADLAENASMSSLMTGPKIGEEQLGSGKLFGWDRFSKGYYGENAEWIPAVPVRDLPARRYWIGIHKSSPPTPEELKKANGLKLCNPVTDDSGNVWQIPVARRLPRVFGVDSAGEVVSEVKGKYHEYWEAAFGFFEMFLGNKVSFQNGDYWRFAVAAFGWNYRVTSELLTHMKVISDETLDSIVEAACDVEAIRKELEEKNSEAGRPADV